VSTANQSLPKDRLPKVRKVIAEYPELNKRDILFEESSGKEGSLRKAGVITLTILARASPAFLAYGTYSTRQGIKGWFAHQINKKRTVISARLPPDANNIRLHFSHGVPSDVDFTNLRQQEHKLIAKHSLIQKQPFMSLGMVPLDPMTWSTSVPKVDDVQLWSGHKNDYNPKEHGPTGVNIMHTDFYGTEWDDNKGPMPHAFAGPEFDYQKHTLSNIMWIKFAELTDNGWRVFNSPTQTPTFVAGRTYSIIGQHLSPSGSTEFGYEMHPSSGHAPPEITFVPSRTMFNRYEQESGNIIQGDIQKWDAGINGGMFTHQLTKAVETDVEPDFLKGMMARENFVSNGILTARAKGMGVAFDDIDNPTLLDFAVEAEWYNWKDKRWYAPSRKSQSSSQFNKRGLFHYMFRFPRQLSPSHPDYAANGDNWKIEKKAWAYPIIDKTANGENLRFAQVGHKGILAKGKEHEEELEYTESLQLDVLVFDTGIWAYDGGKTLKESDLFVHSGHTMKLADPDSLLYGGYTGIERTFFADGDFGPNGTVVLIGRGLDKVENILISTEKYGRGHAITQEFVDQYHRDGVGEINTTKHGFITTFHSQDSIITTKDLEDQKIGPKEAAFQAAFQKIFERPLTLDFFKVLAAGELVLPNGKGVDGFSGSSSGTTIKHHVKGREWNYHIKDKDGEGEFPYSIMIIEIDGHYSGPGVDTQVVYGTKNGVPGQVIDYKVTDATPNKVWIHFHNIFGRIDAAVQVDLKAEIEYQLEQLKQGLEEIEVMGTKDLTDWDMEDHELLNQGKVLEDEAAAATENEDNGDENSSLFDFSWMNPFAKFKTDNWVRQNTLIPYGSREVIEEGD
jgi:hypothetical protein